MILKSNQPHDVHAVHLARLIPDLMGKISVVGFSIALIIDAQLVWSQGFGVVDSTSNQPIDTSTVFQVGSLSKPVFAYAVLKLCKSGHLDLDVPLSTYLPQPYIPDDPRLHQITAHHILSHTSGFPNWRWPGKPLQIHFTPGRRFSYSGEGFVYLQQVVAQIIGQSLPEYLRQHVLAPLGMYDSSYTWIPQYDRQAAHGHTDNGTPAKHWRLAEMNAAYSLYSTPSDFARFMIALMSSPQEHTHLQEDSLTEMLVPQVAINDDAASWAPGWPREQVNENRRVSWSLGWGIQHDDEGDLFWHWGANPHFRAFAIGSRDHQWGLVMMSNSNNGDRMWREILGEIAEGDSPALDWVESLPA